jgi:cobalamin biosynthesis protein CobT
MRVSLLLVDLSASMKGPRLEAALEGVALFALSLARAEQPFALFGFQDELVELLSFDSPKPTSLKGLEPILSALSGEVWGVREGGHNQPQYNDDGPCLLEAAAHLEAYARRCGAHSTQALWVISDGEPRGARSGAEALHAATTQLNTNPRLDLYALGLGEGTEHVTRFYPRAEACVPLEGLVGALGRLITPS